MGMSALALASSLSLEMTISASVASRIAWIASTACRIRRAPSKRKGFVTTPIVRQPAFLAHSATTGAAPEPVPPPMPATTKTRSASRTTALISAMLSSAASRPIAGLPPAPSPRVTSRPICTCLESDGAFSSAWASVLIEKLSTPGWPALRIRAIALLPPPPTPRTRIVHGPARSVVDIARRAQRPGLGAAGWALTRSERRAEPARGPSAARARASGRPAARSAASVKNRAMLTQKGANTEIGAMAELQLPPCRPRAHGQCARASPVHRREPERRYTGITCAHACTSAEGKVALEAALGFRNTREWDEFRSAVRERIRSNARVEGSRPKGEPARDCAALLLHVCAYASPLAARCSLASIAAHVRGGYRV